MRLYLFNPEHDLALAEGTRAYDAPRSALTFAADVACLPVWYADEGSMVLAKSGKEWLKYMQAMFPQLATISLAQKVTKEVVLVPWGYNLSLYKQTQYVDDDYAKMVRIYSHRGYGRDLIVSFQPYVARRCDALEDIRCCIKRWNNVVMKAPWSGSGRGIMVCRAMLDERMTLWVERVISKQGCVMVEPLLDKIQDFAMEFTISNGVCEFEGYSLFITDDWNVYRCNYLLTNEEIEQRLGVSIESLREVQEALMKELPLRYVGYEGDIGVDMLTYMENGKVMLNPLVEVNLRTTMGLVARRFFDRFVDQNSSGYFHVERVAKDLKKHYEQEEKKCPLVVEGGRVISGILALNPICEDSEYYVWVEVEPSRK